MNQRTIYIILSAILLYLYYRRRDLAIFAAFIVVVGATLIFGDGSASASASLSEGFNAGSDKVDKECAKLGFTAPKLDKDDLGGSLEKEMKKIKKVADKHWPYDEKGDSKDEAEKKSIQAFINVYFKEVEKHTKAPEAKNGEEFYTTCFRLYEQVNSPDEKKRQKIKSSDIEKGSLTSLLSGGKFLLKTLEDVSKSDELKDDDGAKNISKYLICLCKHWIGIITKIYGGGDEEEKPKNKNKNKNNNNNNNNNKNVKNEETNEDE
jgi:hypothetical protein